jgi:uncharacterized protein
MGALYRFVRCQEVDGLNSSAQTVSTRGEVMNEDRVVIDNAERKRFELQVGELIAIAEYIPGHDTITFTHTEVPQALEGQGVGSALVKGALEQVRQRAWKVAPMCPFVAAYIKRHPEYQDLVLPQFMYMIR